jgi:hypothetical protein
VLLDSARMLSEVMFKEGLLAQPNGLAALLYADCLPESEYES